MLLFNTLFLVNFVATIFSQFDGADNLSLIIYQLKLDPLYMTDIEILIV